VFVLSFVTAITGVVAANTVITQHGGLNSIDDAIAQGVTVCADTKLPFQAKYPELSIFSAKTTGTAMQEALAAGKCGAMLISESEWEAITRSDKPLCGYTRVGHVAMTVPCSIPARTEYVPVLSWMLAKARGEGWVEEEKVSSKASFFKPVQTCHISGRAKNGEEQISLKQLAGPLVLAFITTTGAMVIWLFQKLSCVAEQERLVHNRVERRMSRVETEKKVEAGTTPDHDPIPVMQQGRRPLGINGFVNSMADDLDMERMLQRHLAQIEESLRQACTDIQSRCNACQSAR
jgi:hypothetical protein